MDDEYYYAAARDVDSGALLGWYEFFSREDRRAWIKAEFPKEYTCRHSVRAHEVPPHARLTWEDATMIIDGREVPAQYASWEG